MIGAPNLLDKYWVQFEGLNIKCLCKDKHCVDSDMCREHIVKLIEIDRQDLPAIDKQLTNTASKLLTSIKKESNELKKSIKKLKGFKI